jgi:hypothetical protein
MKKVLGAIYKDSVNPDLETLWLVLETRVKSQHPECYADLQGVVVIETLYRLAKQENWSVPIGLKGDNHV